MYIWGLAGGVGMGTMIVGQSLGVYSVNLTSMRKGSWGQRGGDMPGNVCVCL